jgi:hypothetical protein
MINMTKCAYGAEIEKCHQGLERGNEKIVCTHRNDPDRYKRHPEEYPAGVPTDYGECDNSILYGSLWRKEPRNPYKHVKPVISVPGPSFAVVWSEQMKVESRQEK